MLKSKIKINESIFDFHDSSQIIINNKGIIPIKVMIFCNEGMFAPKVTNCSYLDNPFHLFQFDNSHATHFDTHNKKSVKV